MRSRVDEDPRVRNGRLTRPGMPSLAGLSATATCILVLLVASRLGTGNTALSLPPLPPISASMEDVDDVEQRDVMIVAAGDTPFGVVHVAVTAAIASGCTHLALVTRAEI